MDGRERRKPVLLQAFSTASVTSDINLQTRLAAVKIPYVES